MLNMQHFITSFAQSGPDCCSAHFRSKPHRTELSLTEVLTFDCVKVKVDTEVITSVSEIRDRYSIWTVNGSSFVVILQINEGRRWCLEMV